MKVLPTLTMFGFVKDPKIIVNKLLDYFMTSMYNQSLLYRGNISSLEKILHDYKTDEIGLRIEVTNQLMNLYKKYFDDVEVEVTIKPSNDRNSAVLYIYVSVKVDGHLYIAEASKDIEFRITTPVNNNYTPY